MFLYFNLDFIMPFFTALQTIFSENKANKSLLSSINGLTHIIEPPLTDKIPKIHNSKPLDSHHLQWISSPTPSTKQHSSSTDCSDDGWVGGGLWEWLDRVAPTPLWPVQQTECTHSSAKDKASAIMCGGGVCAPCSAWLTTEFPQMIPWRASRMIESVGCFYALHRVAK